MEKIQERSMTSYVLLSLLNLGIGTILGLIAGIIVLSKLPGMDGAFAFIVGMICIGVFIFTVGSLNLYKTYFYYKLSLDIDAVCEGDGQESESYIIAVILSFLTFGVYRYYWINKLGQRLRANAPRYGFKIVDTGKDFVILDAFSFGYVAANELIRNTNRIAKLYNQSGVAEMNGGNQ